MNRPDRFARLEPPGVGYAEDQREAQLHAEQERAELRQRELATQCSPSHEPQFRIKTWERLHALTLPKSPSHALVPVIARETALTILEVQDEQKRRAGGVQ
jgi:hypothetical protein